MSVLDRNRKWIDQYWEDTLLSKKSNWLQKILFSIKIILLILFSVLIFILYYIQPPKQPLIVAPYDHPIKQVPIEQQSSISNLNLSVLNLHYPSDYNGFIKDSTLTKTTLNSPLKRRALGHVLSDSNNVIHLSQKSSSVKNIDTQSQINHKYNQSVWNANNKLNISIWSDVHVQLASYVKRQDANNIARHFARHYSNMIGQKQINIVQIALLDNNITHQIYIQGFIDLSSAQKWCAEWRSMVGDCLVKEKIG